MSTITNPNTPERGILQTCSACGVAYHVDDGRPCDCDLDEHARRRDDVL